MSVDRKEIMIVEDDPRQLYPLVRYMEKEGWRVFAFERPGNARAALNTWLETVQVAVIDQHHIGDESSGYEFGKWIKEISDECIATILWTAAGSEALAVEALTSGFDDYWTKGLNQADITFKCESWRKVSETRREVARSKAEAEELRRALYGGEISSVGGNRAAVLEQATKRTVIDIRQTVGPSLMPVLIVGETGTGKESIAREVHMTSKLPKDNFRAVNCAAFTDTLLMSELFGHARGSFTGADSHRLGVILEAAGLVAAVDPSKLPFDKWLVECAKRKKLQVLTDSNSIRFVGEEGTLGKSGTLFLDEVADLSRDAQAALLRFLDGNGISPLGYSGPSVVPDIRIVAATNRTDVLFGGLQRSGGFRADLLWRLAGWIIEIPPLHERVLDAVGAAVLRAGTFQTRAPIPQVGRGLELTEAAQEKLKDLVKERRFSGQNATDSGNFRNLNWLIDRACWMTIANDAKATHIDADVIERAAKAIARPERPSESLAPESAPQELPGANASDVIRVESLVASILQEVNQCASADISEYSDMDIELDRRLVRKLTVFLNTNKDEMKGQEDIRLWFNRPHAASGEVDCVVSTALLSRWKYLFLMACLEFCGRQDGGNFEWKTAEAQLGAKREPFKSEINRLFGSYGFKIVFPSSRSSRPLRDLAYFVLGDARQLESRFNPVDKDKARAFQDHVALLAKAVNLTLGHK